jgi:hypothetical protein
MDHSFPLLGSYLSAYVHFKTWSPQRAQDACFPLRRRNPPTARAAVAVAAAALPQNVISWSEPCNARSGSHALMHRVEPNERFRELGKTRMLSLVRRSTSRSGRPGPVILNSGGRGPRLVSARWLMEKVSYENRFTMEKSSK